MIKHSSRKCRKHYEVHWFSIISFVVFFSTSNESFHAMNYSNWFNRISGKRRRLNDRSILIEHLFVLVMFLSCWKHFKIWLINVNRMIWSFRRVSTIKRIRIVWSVLVKFPSFFSSMWTSEREMFSFRLFVLFTIWYELSFSSSFVRSIAL